MFKKFFNVAAAFALVLISGCATQQGINFDRTKVAGYQPGVTKMDQVLSEVGKPRRERTFTIKKDLAGKELLSPVVIEEISLYYQDNQAKGIATNVEPSRSAWLQFSNKTLIAFVSRSSFMSDSTDFDETMVKKIVKGKTTEAEVEQLFGRPSGRGLYPVAKEAGGSAINYELFSFDKGTRKGTMKRLTVFFNPSRIVSDFDLNISTK